MKALSLKKMLRFTARMSLDTRIGQVAIGAVRKDSTALSKKVGELSESAHDLHHKAREHVNSFFGALADILNPNHIGTQRPDDHTFGANHNEVGMGM